MLCGMEAPTNLGEDYRTAFKDLYFDLLRVLPAPDRVRALPAGRGRRQTRTESGRWHPPQRGRLEDHRRDCCSRICVRWWSGWAAARGKLEVRSQKSKVKVMIDLIDVSRTVRSGAGPLTILHPTSFSVPRGRVVAITGPSGSGKSTILGLIAGLDAPVVRPDSDRRRRHHGARRRSARAAARREDRDRLPVLPSAAVADGLRERARADGDCRRRRRARPGDGAARRCRPVGSRASLSVAAVRRRAAARGHRARAGQRSARAAGRRADRQPRHARRAGRSSNCWSMSIGRTAARSCS